MQLVPADPEPAPQGEAQQALIKLLTVNVGDFRLALVAPPGIDFPPVPDEQLSNDVLNSITAQAAANVGAAVAQGILLAVRQAPLQCGVDPRDVAKLSAWNAGVECVMHALQVVVGGVVRPAAEQQRRAEVEGKRNGQRPGLKVVQ